LENFCQKLENFHQHLKKFSSTVEDIFIRSWKLFRGLFVKHVMTSSRPIY
jgi:hypothetical protein